MVLASKHAAGTNTGDPLISAQEALSAAKRPLGNSPSSCQNSRTPFVCICSNPAMKHRLLYTSPFCVTTEGIPPVPSWYITRCRRPYRWASLSSTCQQGRNASSSAFARTSESIDSSRQDTLHGASAPPCTNRDTPRNQPSLGRPT